ncbi:MAG: putative component of type IV pili like system [Candidatus Methanohalarchaeum thermophilum]|uniref:Component of type IV pili like system n=1 Tax=Methanohalarchaeum thermophilum TaxID=1903181 RepID=A0A1Q6DS60_METT1|nr:MAG: putative component of type IV pili like system [Candidatus Methanohalarchaeum thermophilum]
MEERDIVLAGIMVISVIIFSYEWLMEFWGASNSLIVFSAIALVSSLALMILSLNAKLDKIENELLERERSLRINIKSLEENLDWVKSLREEKEEK